MKRKKVVHKYSIRWGCLHVCRRTNDSFDCCSNRWEKVTCRLCLLARGKKR